VLQGEPTQGLVTKLEALSSGLAGRASAIARSWLAEGKVVWTTEGLDLAAGDPVDPACAHRMHRLLRVMTWDEIDTLCLVAVANDRLTLDELFELLRAMHPEEEVDIDALLDRLLDLGVLVVDAGGLSLRSEADRVDLLDWLRPATLRRMHLLTAKTLDLPVLGRVTHLMAAGAQLEARELAIAELLRAQECGDADFTRLLTGILERLPERGPAGSRVPTVIGQRVRRACAMALTTFAGSKLWTELGRDDGVLESLALIA
jgi:hypothetical protein